MSKLKIGIVGLGGIANKVYLPFLSRGEDWNLAGVFSPTEAKRNRISEYYRVKAFGSLSDLIEASDVVFVNSSTASHFEVVSEALKRGRDVYVDKPLAETLEKAEELVELSIKANRKLMVGFNRRFAPMYIKARNSMKNTALIRIEKHRANGIGNVKFSDTLLDDYIHVIDTAIWLSAPEGKFKGTIKVNNENELIFTEHSYKSKDDASVFMCMHRKSGSNLERLEIINEDSIVRVENIDTMEIEKNGVIQKGIMPAWDTVIKRKGFEGAIMSFINSVLGDTKPEVDGEEGLKAQRYLYEIIRNNNIDR
ncbi:MULTISPECIES: Gfo/Idh/MocA family protein [Clostridium]|uniref:Gfo/Idh/MocA family protein n=1 Tax=Clostridium TaxID=1485 RepID=UPI0008253FD6|nr:MULTISPECIES: Gfo/Idh/MocA family oxidoreductase [Clostridium]